jgi:hypothetical protein
MSAECQRKGKMAVQDQKKALEELRIFLGHLQHSRQLNDNARIRMGALYRRDEALQAQESVINGLLPLVEQIAAAYDERLCARLRDVGGGWPHARAVAACEELIGIIETADRADAIFEPTGPKLSASDLHPWIWNAAVDLWSDGYFREAVQAAATALFDSHTPAKVGGTRDTSGGKDLMSQAFSTKDPEPGISRLRLPGFNKTTSPKDWTSAHEGAMFMGMGAAQGIRNIVTHNVTPLPEQEGLEMLATLSLVARLVDRATAVEAV